jgi:hypothetical protein
MQVVCEATQNPSVSVQVGAFECLVKIMALYYDKMAFYMEQALFGVWPPVYSSMSPPDRICFPAYCHGHEAF